MQGVWLVGGQEMHAQKVAQRFPEAVRRGLILLQTEPISAKYQRDFQEPLGYPSTGFIGTLHLLHPFPRRCASLGCKPLFLNCG